VFGRAIVVDVGVRWRKKYWGGICLLGLTIEGSLLRMGDVLRDELHAN